MAVCEWCEREMRDRDTMTCTGNVRVTYPDGTKMPSLPYMGDRRCHDCNVVQGGAHHPGCDAERCPRCQGQLISCGCLDDDEENDDAAVRTEHEGPGR